MTTTTDISTRETLISAMQHPEFYDHPVERVELIQTHISWVLLTGSYAYKIKKPVDFGFLDFTTLEKRKHFCKEELRLNRRLAPDLYLAVVPITGTPEAPVISGTGTVIEYAVKMKQFDQHLLLNRQFEDGRLTATHMDQIADKIAGFHLTIEGVDKSSTLGDAATIYHPVQQNFEQLAPLIDTADAKRQLQRLKDWSEQQYNALKDELQQRKIQGFVRECHGDMHLGNIATIDDEITIFDGIEFNDEFRWIDVTSEIAFLVMDLYDQGAEAFAHRVLNRYLERTGDYAGLKLLRFYLVYRAMVRAKIASLRLTQAGLEEKERQQVMAQYQSYSNLAERFTRPETPRLYITHGLSGSGKTVLSQRLVEQIGAIRIRSDIERKRLFGLTAETDSKSGLGSNIYGHEATRKTYQQLLDLCAMILEAGYSVIVDATFLRGEDRAQFRDLAKKSGVEFMILSLEADPDTLRTRVSSRKSAGKDASEADLKVLQHQLDTQQPLSDEEMSYSKVILDAVNWPLEDIDR